MTPLISLAVSLASKYVPELIGESLNSKKARAISNLVIDAAKEYTGVKDPEQALGIIGNDKDFWDKNSDKVFSLLEAEIRDVQHSREHNNDDVTKRLSYLIMVVNPILIAAGIYAFIYVMSIDLEKDTSMALSALIGSVITHLLQERQQVMNFRFGSTIGSKLKDLMKKGA